MWCNHSEDGDRVDSVTPQLLKTIRQVGVYTPRVCLFPQPVSDLTTDNTKVRIIYETTKHSPMFIPWVMNMTHRHVDKFGMVDNYSFPILTHGHVDNLIWICHCFDITSSEDIRWRGGIIHLPSCRICNRVLLSPSMGVYGGYTPSPLRIPPLYRGGVTP